MGVQVSIIETKGKGVNIIARLDELCRHAVGVGFPQTGEVHPTSDMLIAQHAAQLVFGSPDQRIPPRDFMRTTWDRNREQILFATKICAQETASRRGTPVKNLKILGDFYSMLMKQNILGQNFTALSPNTVRLKVERGSSHPTDVLLDTEAMFDAIDSIVVRP